MFGVVAAYLDNEGLSVPNTKVLVTADLPKAVDRECGALGLEKDRREGLERVGGVVAGKCLRTGDGRHATVVVPLELTVPTDSSSQLFIAGIVGHELGHLLHDTMRAAEVRIIDGVWLPWEMAGVIALLAAAEFRVGRFGHLVAETALKPTDGEGRPLRLATITGPMFRGGLRSALDAVSPELQATIWQYRTNQLALDAMWNAVAKTSEGVALYLAHCQAATLDERLVPEGLDHQAVPILEPLWRPLFEYLEDAPLIPASGTWEEDRSKLQEIGLSGFTEVWRHLGLTAKPEGDSFHLAVRDPSPPAPTTTSS
jgi:hypothetical protein